MIKTRKFALFFVVLIITTLAVAPAFALGEDNRNLLLIGVMGLSPILIILFNRYHPADLWLLVFMSAIIGAPLLHNPESMRWSTVLYSCMFVLTFMTYTRLLIKSKFSLSDYSKLLRYLILAYALTLLIQQFCVLVDLPIFNISNYNPQTPWKLNALAAEPSHSARIVALLMYSYIVVQELIGQRSYNLRRDIRQDKWVWLAFVWTMVTMGSGTAFLFLPLVLLKFLKRKNIVPLALVTVGIFILMNAFGVVAFERTYNVVLATLSGDIDKIIRADHSASIRIVPFFVLIPMLKLDNLDGWLGHGIDYVSTFLSDYISGVPRGISGGGLLQLWMEYGFIAFLIFLTFSIYAACRKRDYLSFIFWFLLVFLYGINNQIVWLCLIILFTNKIFVKSYNKFENGNS